MASRTRNSSLPPVGNPRAVAAVVAGLLSVAAVPLGVLISQYSVFITLVNSGAGSIPAAVLFGAYAIVLARRGREQVARTLGRSGGEAFARLGLALGVLGICLGAAGAIADGFYGLLTLLAA